MEQPPWGQQPWGQQPGAPQAWGQPPRRPPGTVPLLVLGLVTAVLGLLGTVLPTYRYSEGLGSYAPLYQDFNDQTTFQATGLVLFVGVAALLVGALLVRSRTAVGAGLLLLGGGVFVDRGGSQLLAFAQSLVDGGTGTAVGGVCLVLAALAAGATAVLSLVTLGRAVRA